MSNGIRICILMAVVALCAIPAVAQTHTADQDTDFNVSLSELLRVIQFFNTGSLSCANPPESSEDGYLPGSEGTFDCTAHDSDYNAQDWVVTLSELLRLVQFYNSGAYELCEEGEDGFCPVFVMSEGEPEGMPEGFFEGEGELEGEDNSILVNVGDVDALPGQLVFIPVSFDAGTTETATMDFTLNYSDFRLDFNGAVQGSIVGNAGKVFSATDQGGGAVRIQITDPQMNGVGMNSGGLMTLTFTVSEEADFGQIFTIFATAPVAADTAGMPLDITVAPGAITIDSDDPIPPDADFVADTVLALPGSAVRFTDDSSLGTGDDPVYAWSFGDGGISDQKNPVHVYDDPGTYTVALTVTTTAGNDTETKTDLIEVIVGSRYFVDKTNTKGLNDGTSWNTAFVTIQEGIDAAAKDGGGEVWVAANTYDEARANSTGSLVMAPVVNIYGGFAGVEASLGQRNPALNVTTIDGSISRGGQPARHVVIGANTARLDGFTVSGGRANPDNGSGSDQGGGMLNAGISPVIAECRFEDNEAGSVGAAMSIDNGAPTIVDCVFTGNRVENLGNPNSFAFGGAIYSSLASPVIVDCTFTNNSTTSNATWTTEAENTPSQALGGALYTLGGTVSVAGCQFTNNVAGATGVGFGPVGPETYAALPRALGGAIYNNGGTVTINRSTISSNSASTNQNGFFARACGGGIYNESASVTIKNCDVFNNLTQDFANGFTGSGICNDNTNQSRPVIVVNSTIFGNTSGTTDPSKSGGILNVNANTTIANCIVRGNTGASIVNSNATPSVTYSNISGGYTGDENFDLDPLFVNSGAGNLRLSAGSPCIDAGRDTGIPALGDVFFDIDGDIRGRDGTPSPVGDGSDYDVGADEF